MLVKNLADCKEITAGDECTLRELINANTADVSFGYSLAHAWVKPKSKTIAHKLKTSELYYILSGAGIMHINDETKNVKQYDCIYIPPNATQYIENTENEDLIFMCIVDPAWCRENEQILK